MTECIAEISGNHGSSLDNAIRLIHEAKTAGADAVKFQCFNPVKLAFKRNGVIWEGREHSAIELLALYKRTHTPREWFPTLIAKAEMEGIKWFSSVFDPADVAFLETLGCPRYKISAYEMLDGDLINAVKATGKPIVMSVRPREGLTILRATEYDGFLNMPLGISDHSPGDQGPAISSLGCPMVERHLRLPDVDTPDAAFSSTPEEFAQYVAVIRRIAA